jgi:hypothetical protein
VQIPIDDINVKIRVRKDLGGHRVDSRKASGCFGLNEPRPREQAQRTIAGGAPGGRAELGWKTIKRGHRRGPRPAREAELELEENVQRRELSTDEIAEPIPASRKLAIPASSAASGTRSSASSPAFFA